MDQTWKEMPFFNMITDGEDKFTRVLTIMPDGKVGVPCGACREFMAQLMGKDYKNVQVLLGYENGKIMTLGELTPEWWI